ncbi:AraC family transcriptional regulator [Agriterribacter sp.]|uniref:AraC family transcriptional regulator n=1 Tax=Agriterribacter sp. TaxID=2821509 RepID=UPI002CA3A8BE|nr:AraC family transcriptional regulator [Agriterribacter sp.]HRP54431.1 AraC family transcriptional regulator [Agriterribacter sp.]
MKPLFIDVGINENQLIYFKKIDTAYLDTPFHFHPNCELVYIEEGYGKKVVGNSVSTFNEETLILMGPDTPHILTNDDIYYKGNKNLRSKAIVIYFSPSLLRLFLTPKDLQPFNTLINKSLRGLEITGKTRNVIREKMSGIMEKEGLSRLIIFFGILEILAYTTEIKYLSSKNFVNTFNAKDTDRINTVYQFLMQNFKQEIRLDEVAAIAHLAPTAFCRFFRQHTGKTFSSFLNELRVRHAGELLHNHENSITQISYECGYHNPTNFNKFFKEITGMTPSAYRKKILGSALNR